VKRYFLALAVLLPFTLVAAAYGRPAATWSPRVAAGGPVVRIPLSVSLEWDTHHGSGNNSSASWTMAMKRAARFLETATNGQATIDPITVTDDARGWANADVRVYAANTQRPDATVGGLSDAAIAQMGGKVDRTAAFTGATISSGGVFPSYGSINLGRTWSVFGALTGRWTDTDGYRTIVHEIGHYAFFLYDEYYGYGTTASGGAVRTPAYCSALLYQPAAPGGPTPTAVPSSHGGASIMYWEYATNGFWSLPSGAAPTASCTRTRQWQVYGQTDWGTIHARYPNLVDPASITATITATPAPLSPLGPCLVCTKPEAYRVLYRFDDQKNAGLADGYLTTSKEGRVLHEGARYPFAGPPSLSIDDPLDARLLYPAGRLEVDGASPGDIVHITTAATDAKGVSRTLQAVARVHAVPASRNVDLDAPHWYRGSLDAIPYVLARPIVATNPVDRLLGLDVTALNPLATPFYATQLHDVLSATVYEAGRGSGDSVRQSNAAPLFYTGSTLGSGGELYQGRLSLAAKGGPILDGTLYVTPGKVRHDEERRPSKDGAWMLAQFSVGCNSPSWYLDEHAPGDEEGVDSADGVVTVHLASGSPDLCIGFTAQPTGLRTPGLALSRSYALAGSTPLVAGQTTVTIHYDPSSVASGSAPSLLYTYQTPLTRGQKPTSAQRLCRLVARNDVVQGTLSATLPIKAGTQGTADGVYQAVLLPAASTPPLVCGLRG